MQINPVVNTLEMANGVVNIEQMVTNENKPQLTN